RANSNVSSRDPRRPRASNSDRPAQLFVDCASKRAAPLSPQLRLRDALNPSAGRPTDRVRPGGTGHSTAPFACECQSFVDNFIAGLGVCSQIGGLTPGQVGWNFALSSSSRPLLARLPRGGSSEPSRRQAEFESCELSSYDI